MRVAWALSRGAMGRRPGSLLGLAAVIAVVTAAVLASAAGAHRTVGVLDTYLAATDARDLGAVVLSLDLATDIGKAESLRDAVASVDGVTGVTTTYGYFVLPAVDTEANADADFILTSSPDGRFETMDRASILRGRMPADEAVDEVALNETAADALGFDLGDTLDIATLSPETIAGLFAGTAGLDGEPDGPPLALRVVGVVRTGEELSATIDVANAIGITSPAFASAYEGRVGRSVMVLAITTDPGTDVDAIQKVLDEQVGDGGEAFAAPIEDQFVGEVTRAHRTLAAGIAVFSLVAAAAGLLAIGQAVSRQNLLRAPADQIARGLGATRRERVLAVGLPTGFAIGIGVVVGALGAMALSPLFPLSIARRAELSPGFQIDPLVLGVGTALIAASCLAWTTLSARHIVARTATPPPTRAHRSRLASTISGWGLPASAVVGLRSVAEPGRGPTAVPARSAVLGAAVAISGVIAIATFVTSVRAAESEPARYGWAWSSSPEVQDQDAPRAAAAISSDPDVAAVGVLHGATLQVEGETMYSYALDVEHGSIEFTVLDGHLPTGPHEIALGRRTLDALGLSVGGSVEVMSPSGKGDELNVVGVVVPPLVDGTDPGKGAVLTVDGLDAIRAETPSSYLVMTYETGIDRDAVETRLADEYGLSFTAGDGAAPGQVQQLDGMRDVLLALTAFLAVVGVIGLIHFLAVSVRRRRGQYAILRAMGFVGGQVRWAVAWQAAIATGIGAVIGVPVGVIIGRSAWLLAVREVAMVDDPATPWMAMTVVVVAALVGAAALSLGPGWYAARGRPAAILRTE